MDHLATTWIKSYRDATDIWGAKGLHVCKSLNLIYIETPKCASTSIKANLLRLANQDTKGLKNAELHLQFERTFSSASDLSDVEFVDVASTLRTVFTVVRNPFTRLLSGFTDKVMRNSSRRSTRLHALGLDPNSSIDLRKFLQAIRSTEPHLLDTHWRPQTLLVRSDIVPYTHILRFESLNSQLSELLKAISKRATKEVFPVRRGSRTNQTEAKTEQISAEAREMIKEIYSEDFKTFGYET